MEVIWLFCPDVKKLAGADLDLMQPLSMAIGFERKTENNPITIVFAGINDHLHSIWSPTNGLKFVYAMVAHLAEGM